MIKWKTHQKNTASTCWIYQSAVPEVFVPINGPVVPLFRHFEHLFPCRRLRLLLCGLSTSGADPRLPCPSLLRRCHTSGSAAGLEQQQQQHQLSADRQGRERELKSVAITSKWTIMCLFCLIVVKVAVLMLFSVLVFLLLVHQQKIRVMSIFNSSFTGASVQAIVSKKNLVMSCGVGAEMSSVGRSICPAACSGAKSLNNCWPDCYEMYCWYSRSPEDDS